MPFWGPENAKTITSEEVFFLFYLSSQKSYYFKNVVEKKINKKKCI